MSESRRQPIFNEYFTPYAWYEHIMPLTIQVQGNQYLNYSTPCTLSYSQCPGGLYLKCKTLSPQGLHVLHLLPTALIVSRHVLLNSSSHVLLTNPLVS